jgi:hypothetical protein
MRRIRNGRSTRSCNKSLMGGDDVVDDDGDGDDDDDDNDDKWR